MGSDSENSEMETSPSKDNLVKGLQKKAQRLGSETDKGRDQYAKLQKAVDEEQKKNDEEDERTKDLINQKEDLIYEIKQLKNRKDKLDKQNLIFQKIVAEDPSLFRGKAQELQNQLQELLLAQKQRIEDLGSQLQPIIDGEEKSTDTIGLAGSKTGTAQQQELHSTLTKLEKVLKVKALNNSEPVVNSAKDTNGVAKNVVVKNKAPAKAAKAPAKPAAVKRTPGRKAAAAKSYADDDEEEQSDGSVNVSPAKKRSGSVGSSRASSKRRAADSGDDD